jgi:hypothetical protein
MGFVFIKLSVTLKSPISPANFISLCDILQNTVIHVTVCPKGGGFFIKIFVLGVFSFFTANFFLKTRDKRVYESIRTRFIT